MFMDGLGSLRMTRIENHGRSMLGSWPGTCKDFPSAGCSKIWWRWIVFPQGFEKSFSLNGFSDSDISLTS